LGFFFGGSGFVFVEASPVCRTVVYVANEPRVHREAIAGALALLRPTAEVVDIEPTALASEVARRRPDFLICSGLGPEPEAGVPAWVLLYPGGDHKVVAGVGGEQSVTGDLSFADLTAIVDQVAAGLATDRRAPLAERPGR